jgi:hypothetical protein
MPHIHWVARQNKLEIPRDKDFLKGEKREKRISLFSPKKRKMDMEHLREEHKV